MSNSIVGTTRYEKLAPLDEKTRAIMRDEFKVSCKLTVIYFIFLLMVPILNWNVPKLMKMKLWAGMSLTWFLSSIVAMLLAFIVAALHVYFFQKRFVQIAPENVADSIAKGGH